MHSLLYLIIFKVAVKKLFLLLRVLNLKGTIIVKGAFKKDDYTISLENVGDYVNISCI